MTPRDTSDAAAVEARREALLRVNARGTRVRVGGDVLVEESERLGDVVAIFGRADVRGIIAGNLFTVGGDVHLGPNALVRGNVVAIGGAVRSEPGAYIGGQVTEMRLSSSDVRLWFPDDGEVTVAFQPDWPRIARIFFVSGLMRNLFWFVVCAMLIAVASGSVSRVRDQAAASPLAALAVGFVAELLFVPAMAFLAIVLSLSIVGVPLLALLPIVALAFGLAMALGFTAIAAGLGGRLVSRATPIAALLIGLVPIWGPGMAGRYLWMTSNGAFGWGVVLIAVGFAIEFLVCTFGLGAALLAWSANRQTRSTPASVAEPTQTDSLPPLPQEL